MVGVEDEARRNKRGEEVPKPSKRSSKFEFTFVWEGQMHVRDLRFYFFSKNVCNV